MAYVSKIWVDRQTEYPTRRKLEFDDGSSDKIVTVSREEGTIYAAGDTFDANTMNSLESRIAAGIAEKQDILIPGNGIRIDQDNVISATGGGGGIEFTKVESGSLVSINDAADLPVVDLAVEIEAVQSGTGDPSPSNVRPISGRSSVGLTRAVKNLVGGSKLLANAQTFIPSGTTDTENKTFSFSANAANDEKTFFTGDLSGKFKANTAYTFIFSISNTSTNPRSNLRVIYTDGTGTSIPSPSAQNTKEIVLFTSNASKTVDYVTNTNNAGITTIYYDESGVFEGTLTASQFEPYTGTTVTIALGQTVFGGERNITSGLQTVTNGTVLFDGSESWSKNGETDDYINLVSTVSDLVSVANSDTVIRIKADKFNGVSANTALGAATKAAYQIAAISNSRVYVVMPKTVVDSAAAFKTWLESNNVQIVYELAQPITVQQSGTEVETLLGINNIWADSGDILNLEYYTQSASDVRDFIIKDDMVSDQSSWSSDKITEELESKQDIIEAGDGIVINGNEISAVLYKEMTATLNVFSTQVIFQDEAITTNSVIDIYTSKYAFNPETVTVETGKITITFRQPEEQIYVKVRIS